MIAVQLSLREIDKTSVTILELLDLFLTQSHIPDCKVHNGTRQWCCCRARTDSVDTDLTVFQCHFDHYNHESFFIYTYN